jgi:hypothetical protein
MKKLLFSFLIAFSLLLQLTLAADFSIDVDKKADYVFYATKTDYIKLTISNPLSEDWFTIALLGMPKEWVTPEEGVLKVPSEGSNFILIKVNPSRDALPNIYQYFLKVSRVSSGDYVEMPLLVNIVQITSAIMKDVSLSCKTCIDRVDVTGEIINVGSRNLDLALVLKYGDQQKTVSLGKLDTGEKRDFTTSLDLKDMDPKSYNIDIILIDVNGNVMYQESDSFSIPVIQNIVYSKSFSSTPFGSLATVTAINKGNTEAEADLLSASPKSWYSIVSGPSPTGMMTGYYFWRTSLRPGESTSLNYNEIYWPTYALIIAVVLAIALIYWQSSAFTFSKNVIGKSKFKFGRDISISLHLRSRRKAVEKVAIRDIVPPNFSIVSKFETVKPLIRKVANGIELIWKLVGLKPNEERVLHYTIRPNIETSRKINLPSALAKAASGKGITLKHSNRVSLYPEKEESKIVTVKVSR